MVEPNLGANTFGAGASTLSNAGQKTIRDQEAARSQQGLSGFTNFDGLLGAKRGLSGAAGTGNRSLADIAGQQDITVDEQARKDLTQFFNPTVSGVQQQSIESLAKRASAQGLQGGAVRGQLGDLATQFIAGNRARAFQGVQDVVGSRLNQIGSDINPFLQQVGLLRSGLGEGGIGIPQVLRASGGTSGDFNSFARVGLKALSAVGLGADALAGIAQRQGVAFDNAGLTGAGDVSQAFEQFLSPDTAAFEQFRENHGETTLRGQGTASQFSAGRRLGAGGIARVGTGGRNRARANQRVGAGEQLAGRVGEITQALGSQAASLSAEGTIAVGQFNRSGDIGAARQLAGLDLSRFGGLQKALGLGQGVRTAQGTAGATSGLQFLAGNNLFSSVFG